MTTRRKAPYSPDYFRNPSSWAGVAESAISLNGLNIVPDPGARIFVDPHAHAIQTEGAIRIIAQGAGSAASAL